MSKGCIKALAPCDMNLVVQMHVLQGEFLQKCTPHARTRR
jgi:hypothetical protein